MNPRFFLAFCLSIPTLLWSAETSFPTPYNTEKDLSIPQMPAEEVVKQLKLPEGLHATVFAAEPMIQNPIAATWDLHENQTRLWVVENYTYAERQVQIAKDLRDRIVILTDTDHDGKADDRRVFWDQFQCLTSVEVGKGGVWVLDLPRLLFFEDADRDGVPDSKPKVLLDGFKIPAENHHNFANGLKWGPDGWLYGRCGASAPALVGAPGTPDAQRMPIYGGIWRYHPVTGVVENLTHGTTNPWGHDWTAEGELFFVNTVNGHLWHGIPGAHLVRPHTSDPNPYAYAAIDQHADHFHFDTGKGWDASRGDAALDLGGGHAHSGTTILQGEAWPASLRHRLLTLSLHGRRVNVERLERTGSGFVGRHEPDQFLFQDRWFRGVEILEGPQHDLYILDYSDTGECHEGTGVHRESGRIYRLTAAAGQKKDFSKERLDFEQHPWSSRRAAILSQASQSPAQVALNALWIAAESSVILKADPNKIAAQEKQHRALYLKALQAEEESVRAWGVRLLVDAFPLDSATHVHPQAITHVDPELAARLLEVAKSDTSSLVRLTLASALRRLPVEFRPKLAAELLRWKEDAQDHNLPKLAWYGLIQAAVDAPESIAELPAFAQWRFTRQAMARKLSESPDHPAFAAMLRAVISGPQESKEEQEERMIDLLTGIAEGTQGFQKLAAPKEWKAFNEYLAAKFPEHPEIQNRLRELNVVFGDGRALAEIQAIVLDSKKELNLRLSALKTLIDSSPEDLTPICASLLEVRFLNTVALQGIAKNPNEELAQKIIGHWNRFHPADRPSVLNTLTSHPVLASALLDGIQRKAIPQDQFTSYHARQIRNLNQPALLQKLAEVWGNVESIENVEASIARYKKLLHPESIQQGDLKEGKMLFAALCATCHTLYGEGGSLGPDLTGSNRDNLDYLLENILAPNAVVTPDFKMVTLKMKDGRNLAGILATSSDTQVQLKTMTEVMTIPRNQIDEIQESQESIMPAGLIDGLSEQQKKSLFAYLMHPVNVE